MYVSGPLRKAQLEKVTTGPDSNIDGRIFIDDTLTDPNDPQSGKKNAPTITQGTTNKEILLSGDAVIHGASSTTKPTSAETSHIVPGSIGTNDLADGAVTTPKLQKATKILGPTDQTVQKDDDGAVQGTYQDGENDDKTPIYVFGNIKPHSIDRFELKNDCVTSEKINSLAVTEDKLAANSVQ